ALQFEELDEDIDEGDFEDDDDVDEDDLSEDRDDDDESEEELIRTIIQNLNKKPLNASRAKRDK
ncbi:MAG: hypothetical protein Q9214_008123, partial [Letrouitia sp. 1 TL-2023]